jgi:hypothetical protein
MSRVLLMVQHKEGDRPVCAGREVEKWPLGGRFITKRAIAAREVAHRWWLVEAESAGEARDVIAGAPVFGGRIIESSRVLPSPAPAGDGGPAHSLAPAPKVG